MKFFKSLFPLILCACAASNINQANNSDVLESDDKVLNEEGAEDGVLEEEEEAEPTQEEFEEESSEFILVSGIWGVERATLIEDTCDWDTLLRQFFGVGSDALLPSDFTVEGLDDSFEIEANAYGASGPIECIRDEADFVCETQSVTPVDFDLGAMGWTYAIEFSGEVYDERSLEGTAVVRFPTVSEALLPVFEALQIDVSQCAQTYTLSIRSE